MRAVDGLGIAMGIALRLALWGFCCAIGVGAAFLCWLAWGPWPGLGAAGGKQAGNSVFQGDGNAENGVKSNANDRKRGWCAQLRRLMLYPGELRPQVRKTKSFQ